MENEAFLEGPKITVGTDSLLVAVCRVVRFVGDQVPIHLNSDGSVLTVYGWDGAGKRSSAYVEIIRGGDLYFCLDWQTAQRLFVKPGGETTLRLDTSTQGDEHRLHLVQTFFEGTACLENFFEAKVCLEIPIGNPSSFPEVPPMNSFSPSHGVLFRP